jgi:pimeloyl-ACP methyl ester carboxylesterase
MRHPAPAWADRSSHASHFVTVNGVRLHYLDWGGGGEPLVLLHGLGDSPHCFDDLVPAFLDRHRVVAYARRGHGDSQAKSPYDADTLTEDLRQLLDHLSLPRVHLAGWSLGGRELTRFAELYPERVRTLTYMDAAFDRADPAWRRAVESSPLSLFPSRDDLRSLDRLRQWWQTTWFAGVPWTNALEAYLRNTVREQPDGSLMSATSDTVFAEILAAIVGPGTYRRDYGRVKAPALFLFPVGWLPATLPDAAQRSQAAEWHAQHYRPVRTALIARLRAEIPAAKIVELPGGNHNDFLFSQRMAVIEGVRPFLASQAAGR